MSDYLKKFAWVETILGALGSIIFIWSAAALVYCIKHPAETEVGGAIALAFTIIFSPCLLAFLAGIGALRSKLYGRVINLIFMYVIIILMTLLLIYHLRWIFYILAKDSQNAVFMIPQIITFIMIELGIGLGIVFLLRHALKLMNLTKK